MSFFSFFGVKPPSCCEKMVKIDGSYFLVLLFLFGKIKNLILAPKMLVKSEYVIKHIYLGSSYTRRWIF